MIKETFGAVGRAAVSLVRGWGGLALLHVLYAAVLATAYWFFATGVATAWQLVVSAVTFALAPLLLCVLLTALAHFAVGETRAPALARRALGGFWKILLVTLPLVALGVGLFYLLGWLDGKLPASEVAPAVRTATTPDALTTGPLPRPLTWQETLLSTLWLLLLGFVLPLVAAHLWLSVARDGLKATLRRLHRVAARAFLPRSVLVYALGLFVFGFMPYFVIFTRTPVKAAWGELLLFGLRLALAFVFTLWGSAITLGALAALTPPPPTVEPAAAPPEPSPATPDAEPQPQT
jgi:hypothetical protein